MSLAETMADKSGVIASGMLELSAMFKDQMSFLIHVKRKTYQTEKTDSGSLKLDLVT